MEKWLVKTDCQLFICDSWKYDEQLKHIVMYNVYEKIKVNYATDKSVKQFDTLCKRYNDKLYTLDVFTRKFQFDYEYDEYQCKFLQFNIKDVVSIRFYDDFEYTTKEKSISEKIKIVSDKAEETIRKKLEYIVALITDDRYRIKKSIQVSADEKLVILNSLRNLWENGVEFRITYTGSELKLSNIS